MNTFQTLHPHLFSTQYFLKIFQTPAIQLIVFSNYCTRFYKKFVMVYKTEWWDFSIFCLFLLKVLNFLSSYISTQWLLNFFLKLPLQMIVVIHYFPRVLKNILMAYVIGRWTLWKIWSHFHNPLPTQYYLRFFLKLPPWMIVVCNNCWSLYENVSVELVVNQIVGRWIFVSFFPFWCWILVFIR